LAKAQKSKKERKGEKSFFVKGNKKLSYLKVFLLGADQPKNQGKKLSFETWGVEKKLFGEVLVQWPV